MMRERLLRHKVGTATILAALGVAALTIATTGPSLGDCFGGALSKDPLHCYALEQADKQGIIDVETVYDIGGGILYFSLRQNEPAGSHVYEFLKTKSYEFYDRWPGDVPVNPKYGWWCTPDTGLTYRQCYLERTGWRPSFMLPESMVYTNVLFYTGGEAARRLEPGWAAWRQVWPTTAGGASGSSETTVAFDVSDVDMTNLPSGEDAAGSVLAVRGRGSTVYLQVKDPPEDQAKLEALKETLASEILGTPCDRSAVCTKIYDTRTDRTTVIATAPSANPGTPVTFHGPLANATTTIAIRSSDLQAYHTELSNLLPTGVAAVRMSSSVSQGQTQANKVVIIPVKYGRGELNRWAEILERFVTSTGNTIGITGAVVQDNRDTYGGPTIFRMSPAALGPYSPAVPEAMDVDWSTVRETIAVWGFDPQRIADALPTLLPLLGIPVDAVGEVTTDMRHAIWRAVPGGAGGAGNAPSREPTALEGFKENLVGLRVPLLLLARNVGSVLVVGGIVALVLRLRRRGAPG